MISITYLVLICLISYIMCGIFDIYNKQRLLILSLVTLCVSVFLLLVYGYMEYKAEKEINLSLHRDVCIVTNKRLLAKKYIKTPEDFKLMISFEEYARNNPCDCTF